MNDNFESAQAKQQAARGNIDLDTALELKNSGDYEGALASLLSSKKSSEDAFPDQGSTPAIEVNIGECSEKLGKVPEAIEAYNNCLALIENTPETKQAAFEHLRLRATEGLARLQGNS